MSETLFTIQSSFTDEVDAAFARFKAKPADRYVLDLSHAGRPDRSIVDPIVEKLIDNPAITELVLVHPSPVLGFVASSIVLAAPRVRVRSASNSAEATA